jgi:hypothetical protein
MDLNGANQQSSSSNAHFRTQQQQGKNVMAIDEINVIEENVVRKK